MLFSFSPLWLVIIIFSYRLSCTSSFLLNLMIIWWKWLPCTVLWEDIFRFSFSCICLHLHLYLLPSFPSPHISSTYLPRQGVPSLWRELWGKTSDALGRPNPLCIVSLFPLACLGLVICMYVSVCGISGIRADSTAASLCTWLDSVPQADQLNWFHYLQTPLKEIEELHRLERRIKTDRKS